MPLRAWQVHLGGFLGLCCSWSVQQAQSHQVENFERLKYCLADADAARDGAYQPREWRCLDYYGRVATYSRKGSVAVLTSYGSDGKPDPPQSWFALNCFDQRRDTVVTNQGAFSGCYK